MVNSPASRSVWGCYESIFVRGFGMIKMVYYLQQRQRSTSNGMFRLTAYPVTGIQPEAFYILLFKQCKSLTSSAVKSIMTGNACEKEDAGLRDAVSWLPEEVLGSILSLLPTKQAASTSLLANKWRHVFRLVHNLDFNDYDHVLPPEEGRTKWDLIRESFRKFVDAFQCASPIKKFSLKCHFREESEMVHVNGWIYNAVARGVFEMSLDLWTAFEVLLPCALFTSKTLVKLTLGSHMDLGNLPPGVSLPALKSLFIDTIFFTNYGDLCNVLLPGCPVLEEMSVHMPGMSFHAPNLVSLDYTDYALEEYPQVDLESLVQARLNIQYSKRIKRPDMSGLINGISNVRALHLTPASTNSPKLDTLLIHGLDEYTCDGTMHLVKVKVLHLRAFGGTARESWNI
ncbi:hypothetical protein Bca101_046054 [Brassica carinata]